MQLRRKELRDSHVDDASSFVPKGKRVLMAAKERKEPQGMFYEKGKRGCWLIWRNGTWERSDGQEYCPQEKTDPDRLFESDFVRAIKSLEEQQE